MWYTENDCLLCYSKLRITFCEKWQVWILGSDDKMSNFKIVQ